MKKHALLAFVIMMTISAISAQNYFSDIAPMGQLLYFRTIGWNNAAVTVNDEYPYSETLTGNNLTIPSVVYYNGNPYNVIIIDHDAFSDCTDLTSVSIPSSITNIGNEVFSGCSNLAYVNIGSGVTNIGNYAFEGCVGLTSISIPASVESIGDGAFAYCSGLTSINIMPNVLYIGEHAFYGCSGLVSINVFDGNTVTTVEIIVMQLLNPQQTN